MAPDPDTDTDVVVVGAGPTGLMLAGELCLAGARVVVLERLAEPTGQSRGLGFSARTVEVLDQRGLLPAFGEIETSPMGHFGGLVFDFTVLEGAHFGARSVPQSVTESVLGEWALKLGADIRREREFDGLTQDEHGVRITARTPHGPETVRAAWVVGCDGGQSAVRTAAGIDFPGTPARREMFLADVAGRGLRPRPLGERVPAGMVMSAPLSEGVDRIIVCERGVVAPDRTGPPGFAEVAASWERLTGEDISGAEAPWVSSFTDATRLASEYRRGRVLLAGDAAHIHLPAGGQGLSTGVQDAVNLGWKLGAVVAGRAPAGLLDTYHAERHPVGVRLLANTRAQGLLFLGGEEVEPLRELFAELLGIEEAGRHLAGQVSHLDIRYDVGPGTHPLLGRRLARRALRAAEGEASTTSQLLHAARGVLLDLAGDPTVRGLAAPWADRVDVVTTALASAPGPDDPLADVRSLLVRPDGHVAWVSTATAPDVPTAAGRADDGPAGLPAALHRWFGEPA